MRGEPSERNDPEVTTVPVLHALGKLSGPRQVLLGTVALLLAASGLPWYHLENRGFTIELTGWHEIGVLAWGMAILLLGWEFARMARLVPVGGDEGDRVSAAGGLAVAFVGLLFVLRRLLDGDLGYGWMVGAVLFAALAAASAALFDGARGRDALAARFGDAEVPEESRPHDAGVPRPGAPPTPEWRHPQHDGAPASPGPASSVPAWRPKDAEWSPGGRPPWRDGDDRPPAGADRLPWRAPAGTTDAAGPGAPVAPAVPGRPVVPTGPGAPIAPAVPDAPVVPATRIPVVPSGPGPSVAPEPPPVVPGRVDDPGGWVPPWRRGRRGRAGGADDAGAERGPAAGPGPTRRSVDDVPPWREPGSVSPPPGGWPKSIAEKQRDEPPLWG